jgi:hypothetical protein
MTSQNSLRDHEFEQLCTQELIERLQEGLLQRARALYELARRSGEDENLLGQVVFEISKPANKNIRTVGLVTVSYLGVAGLLESGTESTRIAAQELISNWLEPDRTDLIHFLESLSLY